MTKKKESEAEDVISSDYILSEYICLLQTNVTQPLFILRMFGQLQA